MASFSDIEDAVNIFKQNNCLICLCGLSDHTLGIEVPIVATALGGCIIEKHITLDRNS